MKRIILLIVIPIFIFAEIHNVPVGSKGNIIALNIFNNSGEFMENVLIEPEFDNSYLKFEDVNEKRSIETNTRQSLETIFDVEDSAPIDTVFDIRFNITSENGLKTYKIIQVKITKPEKFELMDNYPNPFNPTTNIKYVLSEESHVVLSVFNLKGQLVEKLANNVQTAGIYSIKWNATNYATGVYLYQLQVKGKNGIKKYSKKMALIK